MTSTRRLFFAFWPTAAMQSDLAAAARAQMESMLGGRLVPRENLHLTLAFLGSVPETSVPALRELAGKLGAKLAGELAGELTRGAPSMPAGDAPQPARSVPHRIEMARTIEVTLDTIDYWPRAQILCAAGSGGPTGAAGFAEHLKASLSSAGFTPDLKPFRLHVTLARQVRGCPSDPRMTSVRWAFSDFALVESHTHPSGSLYSVLESWPLFEA